MGPLHRHGCQHDLRTTDGPGALDDFIEIFIVLLLATVDALEFVCCVCYCNLLEVDISLVLLQLTIVNLRLQIDTCACLGMSWIPPNLVQTIDATRMAVNKSKKTPHTN